MTATVDFVSKRKVSICKLADGLHLSSLWAFRNFSARTNKSKEQSVAPLSLGLRDGLKLNYLSALISVQLLMTGERKCVCV